MSDEPPPAHETKVANDAASDGDGGSSSSSSSSSSGSDSGSGSGGSKDKNGHHDTPATVLYKGSVVKVLTTAQEADYDTPWRWDRPESCGGSGVCIKSEAPGGGKIILTAAHVVANCTFVQIQKSSDPTKAVATVLCVAHEIDLALLAIDENESPAGFLDDVPAAEVGPEDFLPPLRTKVSLVGFPIGGEELSITDGVVSRVEMQNYTHSGRSLLAITVDAAMNSGNSGGPAYYRDLILGIAIQGLDEAQNIGELVPCSIIRHFLESFYSGRSTRIPFLGVVYQTMEAPQLRRYKAMPDDMTGVLVADVIYETSAWNTLRKGDVLLSVSGTKIHNNGTVLLAGKFRTGWAVTYHSAHVGDNVSLQVYRDGEIIPVTVTLKSYERLVPKKQYDVEVDYFIYGGLVFQRLTRGLLETWSDWRESAPRNLVYLYSYGVRTAELSEVVVFAGILSSPLNIGYRRSEHAIIESVNGEHVTSLVDFMLKIEAAAATGDTVDIRTDLGISLFFECDEVATKQPAILTRYKVPSDRSPKLAAAAAAAAAPAAASADASAAASTDAAAE